MYCYDPGDWAAVRSTGLITFPDHFKREDELITIAIKIYKKDYGGAKKIVDKFSSIDSRVVYNLVTMSAKMYVKDNEIDDCILSLIKSLIDAYNVNDKMIYNNERPLTIETKLNMFIFLVQFVLNDYCRLNELLSKGNNQFKLLKFRENGEKLIDKYIRPQCNLDPYMLDDDNYNIYLKGYIGRPGVTFSRLDSNKSYLEHKKTIDALKYQIPLPNYSHLIKNSKKKNKLIDYSKQSEPLFWYNNILYYGNREKVYNAIIFLKKSVDMLDFSGEPITLNGSFDDPLPSYLINIYIHSCHTGSNNLNRVAQGDIIQFIKFIDQYPTQTLSIDILEPNIVEYFELENIKCGSELDDICDRYKLKLLYLYLHNEKVN